MLCLGIETSCDETSLAIIRDGEVASQTLRSQEDLHAIYGGVVPEIASREHLRALPGLLDQVLSRSGVALGEVDAVAVTRGPGLMGSLLVGMGLAKGLVQGNGAALVGVDHLQAHMIAPELGREIAYPALGLLISGGHTRLYLLRSNTDMEILGRTLDDAVGEAFDKTAKLLNLPYPGGKYIDRIAGLAEPDSTLFPRPYVDNQNLDFSFSGLKTAVANYVRDHPELRLKEMEESPDAERIAAQSPHLARVCASFSWSVSQGLRIKLERALRRHPEAASLVVAGGVAANSMIRRTVEAAALDREVELILPEPELCTDNAAMVAYTGAVLHSKGWCHDLDLEAVPRGRAIPWDYLSCATA
ncbi:MAG: tRNA (adenosine(37)-N6)-threonylcarbamoyltransferase complex transferase subunit TsaD [Desulfohalobiaceae bacterium]